MFFKDAVLRQIRVWIKIQALSLITQLTQPIKSIQNVNVETWNVSNLLNRQCVGTGPSSEMGLPWL